MTTAPLRVLQVSSAFKGGGAGQVAASLHFGLLARGHEARLAVGAIGEGGRGVIAMPEGKVSRFEGASRTGLMRVLDPLQPHLPAARRLHGALATPGAARRWLDRQRGREGSDFPGTYRLLDVLPWTPEVVHCHNLHGFDFDLRYLARLSRAAPLMLTLHDEWLFTGHCASTLGCDRWRDACGSCPHLDVYPALKRDGSAANRRFKLDVFSRSSFYVSAPSTWLVDRARESILTAGAVGFRMIRNGIDRSVFHEHGRAEARTKLGIPDEARVLLFAANQARSSPFKDYETVAEAARRIAASGLGEHVILLSLGEAGPTEKRENYELRPIGFEPDRARVADYYRVADLYLHAAKAESAGLTILEALSCGTPVVATAVGGIPEQIHGLAGFPGATESSTATPRKATGVLVPAGDPASMAAASVALLGDRELMAHLSENAVADVAARSTMEVQLDSTVAWYREALEDWGRRGPSSTLVRA